jgi:hypothetical protein
MRRRCPSHRCRSHLRPCWKREAPLVPPLHLRLCPLAQMETPPPPPLHLRPSRAAKGGLAACRAPAKDPRCRVPTQLRRRPPRSPIALLSATSPFHKTEPRHRAPHVAPPPTRACSRRRCKHGDACCATRTNAPSAVGRDLSGGRQWCEAKPGILLGCQGSDANSSI